MSSEREAAESRLLTGSTPSSSTEAESTASMGDVLTKEQHKDDDEAPPPPPTIGDAAAQAQPEPPPPLPSLDVPAALCQRFEASRLPTPQAEQEKIAVQEDRLSEKVESNGSNDAIENREVNASLKNNEQSQGIGATVDYSDGDLCNCEDCKWKKKDLSAKDLQEMMKLRRLGMDLRQYIRYTFNWFIESSGFSENSVKTPLPYSPNPPLDSESAENITELRASVALLCERVPYHLFMWLVGQAQEFVIGVKVQLLTLLYDRSIENLAEVFLTKLLDGYEALLATAVHISDLLEPLQKELFSKVNLTWSYINKSLYQNYVYSDPLIQNNLPPFIGQLRKHLPVKGSEYHYLVHRYLAFDDEITKIGSLCPEIERLIDKYNAEQVTGSVTGTVMKKLREDFDQKLKLGQPTPSIDLSSKIVLSKEVDDSIVETEQVPEQILEPDSRFHVCSISNAVEIQSMFSDWKKSPQQRLADLVEALTLSSPVEEVEKTMERNAILEKQCYSSCLDKTLKDGINKSVSCERLACKCHPNNVTAELVLNLKEEKFHEPQLNPTVNHFNFKPDNLKGTPQAPESNESDEINDPSKEPMKNVPKTTTAQTAQTQTRHSTTQTTNSTHPHNQNQLHRHHHPGRCSSHSHLHGSLSNAVIKSSGPHRTHVGHNNHQSAAVTCPKPQHLVEHIKRLSTSDLSPGENGDCSDSGSSHEDCSATNSPTPRDPSRHCDCCYCEVFGHGVPSVAPVSRNYNEMRERLRQILSKKKAKVCKAACNPHAKNSVEVSSSSSSLSSSSSTSSTITNVDSAILPNPTSRSNTPVVKTSKAAPVVASRVVNIPTTAAPTVPPVKPKEDLWNIEAAVEFIEGNQSGKKDSKKAEKKARQKQKKLEEKQKKEKAEEDKQKLLELQKKTPEVTITVVNPQKKTQKISSQQKLPEVSILPTSGPRSTFTVTKSTNIASKKKSIETTSNSTKNINAKAKNTPLTLASLPTSENAKKKTANVENEHSCNTAKFKSSGKIAEPAFPKTAVTDSPPFLSNLTKKERRKLRREMEKQEALKKEIESKQPTTATPTSSDNQLQIVTIKRVMESNNAEPTVTITLKGQTPAEDRVLFTLINGQTKDSDGEKQTSTSGKKKKNKANNSTNQQQQGQGTHNKSQQSQNNNLSVKSESAQKQDSKNVKQQQQQQSAKDKSKNGKQQEEQKVRQQLNTNVETKSTKSKKDKKNTDNKENIKQITHESPPKQGASASNKKTNKGNKVSTSEFIQSTAQKQQQKQQHQQQQLQQQQSTVHIKNAKSNKNQNQNQNQKKTNNNNQSNSGKMSKTTPYSNNVNQSAVSNKIDNQKVSIVAQNTSIKQKQNTETVQNQKREQLDSSFNSYYRETTSNVPSSINIENLKLPPGITITKVNAPAKPLQLKSSSPPKPANTPKQTTIIAAPMSGVQSSNYGPPQGTGNVIVVDTGRLKQDLIPKNMDKDAPKDINGQTSSSKKKKKKKNKNGAAGNNDKSSSSLQSLQGNRIQVSQQQNSGDYMNVEPARILHNPTTNMVTIRNPAFGPPPPKMEPSTQQAAIIRVAENGMVTIRSPALQQAINAGLQPPPKPEFIVKGTTAPSERPSHNNFITNSSDLAATARGSNGMPLSSDIAELRRRLAQPSFHEQASSSSTLFNNGLSSIQISKVTNGQSPNIPENGINLKGTSVTLTKIRNVDQQQHIQSQHQQVEEPRVNGNAKSRNKKKKRGNGVRSGGDDLTFLESVFTPKDIDLEDGEMDDAERELEAFKRFCLQSVPPPRKEKVNLNIKDIVLKKKSSSSSSSTSTSASAAAKPAAVVAAI
ncbi:uncharacterized protein LOC100114737 isoform X2 [Nasonia vitripennis]|uniref:FAM193 C-terminal domain-containing protein n=1 Tax=Nasonia vitripennis TaxID=7425 RepID=A0A7M7QCE1_NASVI|nr:uncharacterized protein LOC100114737 isoform X2 [Nasonia vitripennis]